MKKKASVRPCPFCGHGIRSQYDQGKRQACVRIKCIAQRVRLGVGR